MTNLGCNGFYVDKPKITGLTGPAAYNDQGLSNRSGPDD
jgi:hypothetical protein